MRVRRRPDALHDAHKPYAKTLKELGLAGLSDETLVGPLDLTADDDHFEATVQVRLAGRRDEAVARARGFAAVVGG